MRVGILAVFAIIIVIVVSGCTYNYPLPNGTTSNSAPYENVSYSQMYGILDEPSLKINDWTTRWVVREPDLNENEKQTILGIVNESSLKIFVKGFANETGSDFLNKHFHVVSANIWSIYNGNTAPPFRQDLKSVALMVYYDFTFDWLKITNQRYQQEGSGSSTGPMFLIINIIDYKNGEFVKSDKVVPLGADNFIAFRDGIDSIISKENASDILNNSFTTRGKTLDITVDYFIRVSGRQLQPIMEGMNFVSVKNKTCPINSNENKQFTYTSCEVNLVSGNVQCSDKEAWCFYYA